MRTILSITLILFFMSAAALAQNEFSESAPYAPRVKPSVVEKQRKKEKKSEKKPDAQNQSVAPIELPPTKIGESVSESENVARRIPVTIFDAAGSAVRNLQKSDFKIFVDDKEQEISKFGTSVEPLNVVLMIDVSPSTAYNIEDIKNYANALVGQLKPQDRVLIIGFAEQAVALTDLTNDRQEIDKAVKKLKFGDGTSLYDAIKTSLQKRISLINGRKMVILITDGVDTTSRNANFETSLLEAEKNDAAFYAVYIDTSKSVRKGAIFNSGNAALDAVLNGNLRGSLPRQSDKEWEDEYENGRQYLADLTALSGGQVVITDIAKTKQTGFENIFEAFRNQFYLSFIPSEKETANQRKQIKVRVSRPNLLVRARGSYIVGANAPAAK